MDDARVARYFKREDQLYVLAPAIRRLAQFKTLNLASDLYPALGNDTFAMDLILCRNVFIYFGADTVSRIMGRFDEALAPGGLVLTAPADIIEQRYGNLRMQLRDGVHFFARSEASAEIAAPTWTAEALAQTAMSSGVMPPPSVSPDVLPAVASAADHADTALTETPLDAL